MNTTPCNNCIGNLSLFPRPKDTRIDAKLFKISSSQQTGIKSSFMVGSMAAYGQKNTELRKRIAGGPGDLIGSGRNGQPGIDVKHGGYFRYLMRKRAIYTKCGSCGGR
tara:strand:+ start:5297 stop:5620 length:324 start_codon:yes stop_codon:yes gene_type:complete